MKWNLTRLASQGNANDVMAEILGIACSPSDLRVAIFDTKIGHVVCCNGGPNDAKKLELDSCTQQKLKGICGGNPIVVLCYDTCQEKVYVLDSVKEIPVASCILICAIETLLNGGASRFERKTFDSLDDEFDEDDNPWSDDEWSDTEDDCDGEPIFDSNRCNCTEDNGRRFSLRRFR